MATEAQRRAVKKYDKENVRNFALKLNKNTDADLIEHIGKQNGFNAYIKMLIRRDIDGSSKDD